MSKTSNKPFISLLSSGESLKDFENTIDHLMQSLGEEDFSHNVAAALISATLPETAVPQSLRRFLPMICDGLHILISHTPYSRLKKILKQQLLLPKESVPSERLVCLAMQYPTLQKLGQIVARNPTLDPGVKKWLVALEVQHDPEDDDNQLAVAQSFVEQSYPEASITVAANILARASVANVIKYSIQNYNGESNFYGVVKLLKQGIRDTLEEELKILDDALIMFENNRSKYDLADMEIRQLFQAVRKDLLQEVDLHTEQCNLVEAANIFGSNDKIRIPELFVISNPGVTAMEYIDGKKITDTCFSQTRRKKLARLLFETLICQPLFSSAESALFHGDPHAGNILVVNSGETSGAEIALLDWTLAGHLEKNLRMDLIELIVGIQMVDSGKVFDATVKLSTADNSVKLDRAFIDTLLTQSRGQTSHLDNPLRQSFMLLEELIMAGVVFPAELVLFRKTFFTLEGVLADISRDFDPGTAMLDYLKRLLVKEIPQRYAGTLFPMLDKASNYSSMISNQELRELSMHHSIAIWEQYLTTTSLMLEAQARITKDLFCFIHGKNKSD